MVKVVPLCVIGDTVQLVAIDVRGERESVRFQVKDEHLARLVLADARHETRLLKTTENSNALQEG